MEIASLSALVGPLLPESAPNRNRARGAKRENGLALLLHCGALDRRRARGRRHAAAGTGALASRVRARPSSNTQSDAGRGFP